MGSQLGWVQFSRALGARRSGAGWGDDERPARVSRRDARVTSQALRRGFRPLWTVMAIAVVAVTIVGYLP